ncbi:MAG TPA: SdiA-regulated domain-containing protein [Saprospiraceae bacterium]|nr:SdiA-regulated domain-containing protein [Saprospiraceae bacterium]HMQ85719.1 SdiA-regulated domain-containing protein [Saprospiraceae bacterium]
MKKYNMLETLLLLCALLSCGQPESSQDIPPQGITLEPGFHFPYNTGLPEHYFALPGKLEEVSGLSPSNKNGELLAVQDENGIVYKINASTGEVLEEITFWKDGDYEGVEAVGDKIYVVKSSGTLYEISPEKGQEPLVEKYNFFLNEENDVEGLAYDPKNNRLLLACKAKAGQEATYKKQKGIYAFDLSTKTLSESPVFLISTEMVGQYLDTQPALEKLEKLTEFFDPTNADFGFSPSAIAIHPMTGEIYVLSSSGKVLLVMNVQGTVLHLEKLSKKEHAQPEGLCFSPDGTLYIANEGKGADAKIYSYSYKNK